MFTSGAIAFWKNHLKVEEERPRTGQVDYLQSLKGEFITGSGPGNSGGKLEKGQVSASQQGLTCMQWISFLMVCSQTSIAANVPPPLNPNTGYFVWFHSIDPTEWELEVYDFPLRGPFSVCIFGMVLYSDSCPYIPSSSFLAQPEFISFDTMLSEESFKSSSLFHT